MLKWADNSVAEDPGYSRESVGDIEGDKREERRLAAGSSTSFQYYVSEDPTYSVPYSIENREVTSTPGRKRVSPPRHGSFCSSPRTEKLLPVDGTSYSPFKFQMKPLDSSTLYTSPAHRSINPNFESARRRCLTTVPSNKMSLFFTMCSVMISLPCLFRFPLALVQYGGSAFLVCYFLTLFFIGYPVLYTQYSLGLQERLSPARLWRSLVPVGGGVGTAISTMSLFLSIQYCVYTAYAVLYLIASLHNPLPWGECSSTEWGANSYCSDVKNISHLHQNTSKLGCFLLDRASSQCNVPKESNAVQFWERYILKREATGVKILGELGEINPIMIGTLTGLWIVCLIFFTICSESAMRKARCGMFLLILCFSLVISTKVLFSPRSLINLGNILSPKWASLSDPNCWREAIFLSCLGPNLHTGAIQSLASNTPFHTNSRTYLALALFIHIVMCFLFSIYTLGLSGSYQLGKFSALGEFPLASTSHGLALQPGAQFWCHVFFATVVLLGLLSIITLLSVIMTSLQSGSSLSLKGFMKHIFLFLAVLLTSLPCGYSTGSSILLVFERWATGIPILILAVATTINISWLYGVKKIVNKEQGNLGNIFVKYLKVSCCLTPFIFMYFSLRSFLSNPFLDPILATLPSWTHTLGCLLAGISILQLPLWALLALIMAFRRGSWRSLVRSRKEDEDKLFDKNSLTCSYRNFDKCDLTESTTMASPIKNNISSGVYKRSPTTYKRNLM